MNHLKIFLFFNLFSVLLASTQEQKAFASWKKNYNVKYGSTKVEAVAFNHFYENFKFMENHNKRFAKGKETYSLGLWSEADRPVNETAQSLNLAKLPPDADSRVKQRMVVPKIPIPLFLNYTKLGYVNPIQNQKKCGSCYTFASCGAIEAQFYKKNKELVVLSEQQLLDCVRSTKTLGCKGGVVGEVFKYIMSNGVTLNETYPYKVNDTFKCSYKPNTSVTRIKDYFWLQDISENDMMYFLNDVGPLVVVIDGSKPTFVHYKFGVYSDSSCSSTSVNHAMLLVGYGNDAVLGKYWLIKNSYGEKWGERGYLRLARGINQCGILVYVSYVTM